MPDHVQAIAANVFQVPADSVTDDLAFNEFKPWDSVNHINLMLAIEEAFGISIADDDIVELTSIAAIRDYLTRQGVAGGELTG